KVMVRVVAADRRTHTPPSCRRVRSHRPKRGLICCNCIWLLTQEGTAKSGERLGKKSRIDAAAHLTTGVRNRTSPLGRAPWRRPGTAHSMRDDLEWEVLGGTTPAAAAARRILAGFGIQPNAPSK